MINKLIISSTLIINILMLWMIFWWLPIDISQGPVAKTIFIHVPLAWCSMIAICVVAISSILYLFTKKTFEIILDKKSILV